MGDGCPRTSTVLRVLAVAYERSSAAVNAPYAVRTAIFSADRGSTAGTTDDDATEGTTAPGRHQTEPHPKPRNP